MAPWFSPTNAQAASVGSGGGVLVSGAARSVSNISHGFDTSKKIPWPFTGPTPIATLQFTVAQLSTSIARVTALTPASPALVSALCDGKRRLLDALLDKSQTPLSFTSEVEYLADASRTAFSGDFGAGVTDLYMTAMGYYYRCNGRELIHTAGKICDFIYDGPPTHMSGVVLAEAKGSIANTTTLASVTRAAQDGYRNQVDPHVGTTEPTSSLKLLHGYAIGIGTQPRPSHCDMHVEETGPATLVMAAGPAAGGPTPTLPYNPGSSGGRGGASGGAGSPTLFSQPDARVALPNFRGIFRMLGAERAIEAINAVTNGTSAAKAGVGTQDFVAVQWRDGFFVTTSLTPPISRGSQTWSHVPFGLRLEVTTQFLGRLRDLSNTLSAGPFPFYLSVRPMNLGVEMKWDDGGAELPDGLAHFGPQPRTIEVGTLKWDPREGLSLDERLVKATEGYF